jgi:chemotaxis signal transduction protein
VKQVLADETSPELAELLAQRAERLRRAPEATDEEALLWVAEFRVGEDTYALPLDLLRAAVPLRTVTPVPLAPPHVVGILRFQGQIITAHSLASLVGARGWREDPAVLLVVDPGWGRLLALDCEQIPKPVAIPHSAVEQARARSSGAVLELTLPGLRQVHLLDLRRLFDRRAAQEQRHD